MDTTSTLPAELQEAVQAEAEAHGFDEAARRWLALLLQDDACPSRIIHPFDSNSRFVAAICKSRAWCHENALRDYEIAATTRRFFP
jgi:hypothetical protein